MHSMMVEKGRLKMFPGENTSVGVTEELQVRLMVSGDLNG